MTSMGIKTDNLRRQFPEIVRAYELYLTCRSQAALVVEKSKGKDTIKKIVIYTNGYSQLPAEGGVLDQPIRLMAFFSAFREGDSIATANALK